MGFKDVLLQSQIYLLRHPHIFMEMKDTLSGSTLFLNVWFQTFVKNEQIRAWSKSRYNYIFLGGM